MPIPLQKMQPSQNTTSRMPPRAIRSMATACTVLLAEEPNGEQHGEDDAELVDGRDLGDLAVLEREEINALSFYAFRRMKKGEFLHFS